MVHHEVCKYGIGIKRRGSVEEVVVTERGFPPIALDMLNSADMTGDVVLVKGEYVRVDYSVGCDFSWLPEDCATQQDESRRKDRIERTTSDGTVVDKAKRGRETSGVKLLKAKTLAADSLAVRHVRWESNIAAATSDIGITVVADPTTAALVAQVAKLKAQVAELQFGQGSQEYSIGAIFVSSRRDDHRERVARLSHN